MRGLWHGQTKEKRRVEGKLAVRGPTDRVCVHQAPFGRVSPSGVGVSLCAPVSSVPWCGGWVMAPFSPFGRRELRNPPGAHPAPPRSTRRPTPQTPRVGAWSCRAPCAVCRTLSVVRRVGEWRLCSSLQLQAAPPKSQSRDEANGDPRQEERGDRHEARGRHQRRILCTHLSPSLASFVCARLLRSVWSAWPWLQSVSLGARRLLLQRPVDQANDRSGEAAGGTRRATSGRRGRCMRRASPVATSLGPSGGSATGQRRDLAAANRRQTHSQRQPRRRRSAQQTEHRCTCASWWRRVHLETVCFGLGGVVPGRT